MIVFMGFILFLVGLSMIVLCATFKTAVEEMEQPRSTQAIVGLALFFLGIAMVAWGHLL